jgi:hypothetical protein
MSVDTVRELAKIAHALRDLGNGDAATRMGAIEAHGKALHDATRELANAITGAAELIAAALEGVAEALHSRTPP